MTGRIVLGAALACVAAMAAVPGGASAGGFSTVGLTSPPPPGVQAGQTWDARFTLLAHGRTPATGMTPVVKIEPAGGGDVRTIRAVETDEPGAYRARVVFPAGGRWAVEVAEHRLLPGHAFGQVKVGASMASDRSSGGLPATLTIALALGLLAGACTWLGQRGPATPRSTAQAG